MYIIPIYCWLQSGNRGIMEVRDLRRACYSPSPGLGRGYSLGRLPIQTFSRSEAKFETWNA